MTLIDNHTHILLADILEMVASAKANNISVFSMTEHVSQFKEPRESIDFGSVHSTGRIFASVKEYDEEFRRAKGESSEMKINRGLEVDFSPRYETSLGDFVNQEDWDILLCSVHESEDGKDIERNAGPIVDPAVAYERWRDYLTLEQRALESDFVPFRVLAHPVRMSRSTKALPPELDDLLLDLARMARKKNKALELNGNDIDYAPGLVRRLATACSMAGCKVSLGSDAHQPRDVFRNMRIAMALVNELNLESS